MTSNKKFLPSASALWTQNLQITASVYSHEAEKGAEIQ